MQSVKKGSRLNFNLTEETLCTGFLLHDNSKNIKPTFEKSSLWTIDKINEFKVCTS
jgi:hypothetical protein